MLKAADFQFWTKFREGVFENPHEKIKKSSYNIFYLFWNISNVFKKHNYYKRILKNNNFYHVKKNTQRGQG